MTEYIRPEIKAWNSISEKDREFIKKVATFADDIDELGMPVKRALVEIYDKLNERYKHIDEENLKDMNETEQVLEKLDDFRDILDFNIEFENHNLTKGERAKIYKEWAETPTETPTETKEEQQMINNFNNLTEEQKTTFLNWIPTYNTNSRDVSGKTVPATMRSIFQKIQGDPTKKPDDLTAQDKINIINTIGGYAFSKSPAFNDSFNELLNSTLTNTLNPALTNTTNILNALYIDKLPDVEAAADDFEDGLVFSEFFNGQNKNDFINSLTDLAANPGNGPITEEEQQNEDIKPNPGIEDKKDEQQQINKKNLPIENNDILPLAPTGPIEEEQEEQQQEQEEQQEIIPIPDKSVPAVVGGLVDKWFTKDSSIADVLEDTEKIISLLTPEQYDRIEDDLADQLITTSDDGGNKLFQDKAQAIKFLRSFRNKTQKQYKPPVAIQRIEKQNTGLNYQLSPLILRSRIMNTKSYKFYNE